MRRTGGIFLGGSLARHAFETSIDTSLDMASVIVGAPVTKGRTRGTFVAIHVRGTGGIFVRFVFIIPRPNIERIVFKSIAGRVSRIEEGLAIAYSIGGRSEHFDEN